MLTEYVTTITCRVDDGTVSKAVVLQSPTLYDGTGFVPAAYITDHGNQKFGVVMQC